MVCATLLLTESTSFTRKMANTITPPSEVIREAITEIAHIFHNDREFKKLDLRVDQDAKTITEFYHGYKYIMKWPNNIEKWTLIMGDTAYKWCEANCKGAFANHVLNEFGGKIFNGSCSGSILAEEGCYWAFELEEDMIMFSLRW